MTLTVERTSDEVLTFRHKPVKAGWSQWYLLAADVHFDNPLCDRKLFFRHLDQAKERDARVFLFGDTLDAMQSKSDRRASKDELAPEYSKDNYLDLLVDDTAEKLKAYADLFEIISLGNHEDAVLQHHGSNLARRLALGLNAQYFGYAGFVRFRFAGAKGHRTSRLLYFHHGAGGGGPVTRGSIQTSRRAVYLPDADIVVSGHIHEEWLMPITRIRVSDSDKVRKDRQYHVQLPTYKDEYDLTGNDWSMRTEKPPKPLGAWWMRFSYDSWAADNIIVHFEMAI